MQIPDSKTAAFSLSIVGLLTRTSIARRIGRICGVALALSGPALVPLAAAEARITNWQPVQDIKKVAEEFLKARIGQSDQRVTPKAGYLDGRMQLPLCDQDLEPFLRPGSKIGSRTIVGVRCNGTRPWKMYIPVNVNVIENVLVAGRALPRGHILTADDVTVEARDISGLVGGYISSPSEMFGRSLKHPLMSGAIVTPSMLKAEILIKRGQTVTLLVRNEALNISMGGVALMDGIKNQRIRVENKASRRVVEGLVRSAEYVEVLTY